MPANAAAQGDSGDLMRDLQADLAALAVAARAGAARATAGAGATAPASISQLRELLIRVRAMDLLLDEHHRAVADRLQRSGVSAAVLARHQDNSRIFRERIDRLYAAAIPLTEAADNPIEPARLRAALNAIADELADAADSSARTPIGASLPYRSLALPQVAPQLGAPITPAYLSTPVPAPQAADLAESPDTEFTAAIRAQAAALRHDSIAIFEFVQNSVRSEFYYGAMKDASETLRQLGGNDTDQASLLIALLRASGVPARYVRGVIRLSGPQALSWTGAGSTRRAAAIFTRGGMPFRPVLQGGTIGAFEIEHTWVEAYVPYSNYRGVRLGTIGRAWIPLDPSFKALDVTPGEDVLSAMGFRANTLVAEYLSQTQAQAPMDFYRSAIGDYLTQTGSPLTVDQVFSTRTIRAVQSGLLPGTLPYSTVSINEEGAAVADSLRHRVRFVAAGEGGTSFDVTVPAADLAGRRLTLSYVPATVEDQVAAHSFLGLDNTPAYLVKLRPVLKIGGVVKAAGSTPVQMGAFHSLTVEIQTPRGAVSVVNSMLAGGYYAIGLATQPAAYDIPLVRAPDDTEHRAADRLYSIAIDYIRRWNEVERSLEGLLRVVNVRPALSHVIVGTVHARTVVFGQPQSIDWRGVYVDADLRVAEPVPTGADDTRAPEFMRLSGLAGSVLEADVLRLNLNVDAVSAASVIQLARESGVPIEEVTAANVADVLTRLQTADVVKTEIADAVDQGWRVTIPQRDLTRHIWTGIGYVMIDPAAGAGGYFISGGLAGGSTTQTPEEWAEQSLAEELGSPYDGEPNTDPTAARSLTKVAITDKQNGIVGKPLERELAVWARDENGVPVQGATVLFVAADGEFPTGTTFTATTNHLGIAKAPFTLGTSTSALPFHVRANAGDEHTTQVGHYLVNAYAEAEDAVIALEAPFEHFAYPSTPHHITKVAGDNNVSLSGTSGGTLLARLEDEFNNPISNASLLFEVQAATAVSGQLPVTARNIAIYPQQPPCPTATPLLGSCDADQQEMETTSSSGAAVETILGDTDATRYRVSVRATSAPSVPMQVFELTSEGDRTLGSGDYAPPRLHMTLTYLLNDRGGLVDGAQVGTVLGRPLEVTVFVAEDDYSIESTGAPCVESPDQPACWRIESRETKRLRPIGRNVFGTVTFPTFNSSVVTGDRAQETATVTFTPSQGGGITQPIESPSIGRYTTRLMLGPEPALNLVDSDVSSSIWVPCFDLRSASTPVEAKLATSKAGQLFLNQFACTGTRTPLFHQGNWTVIQHAAVGVRATIREAGIPVSETGVATPTPGFPPPPFLIPFLIEPAAYDAANAEVDLFQIEADGSETWLGLLPTTATSGSGAGVVLQGTGFDVAKEHTSQLVLNRGSSLEIRSEKAQVHLLPPSTLQAAPAITVRTMRDPINQIECSVPSDGLPFYISRAARITIRVDGRVLESGGIRYENHKLDRGLHFAGIAPALVPPGRPHAFEIASLFAGLAGQPDIVRVAQGPIYHDVFVSGTLPVGHSVVAGTDLATGAFALTREDVKIPGHGPSLEFRRNYSSAGVRSSGPMGAGWSHNYESRVVIDPCGGVTLMGGEGSGTRFSSPVSQDGITTFTPQAGYHGSLTATAADDSYDYYTPQGSRHHFERILSPGDAMGQPVIHRLAFIEDVNGNRMTLTYDAAPPFNLTRVMDASGRTLTFRYQSFGAVPEPRIASIHGPVELAVNFEYDAEGNLRRATRGPRTERYEYSTGPLNRHNLIRILGPNNAVDSAADITELAYFAVSDEIPGLGPNTPEPWELLRIRTDGAGTPQAARHTYAYNFTTDQTVVTDPRGVSTRYTMDAQYGAVLEKRVLLDSGDNVSLTRWAFQDGVNDVFMSRTTDPLGRVITYGYDAKGNPNTTTILTGSVPYAGVTRADGTSVTEVAATDTFNLRFGRPTKTVNPEGQVTDYVLDATSGNVQSITTYPGGAVAPLVERRTYANANGLRGLLKTVIDPRGATTTNDAFDEFGNATRVIDAEGNVTTNVYDARSRLRETHDSVGRHRVYEYDDLDRVTSITDTTLIQPSDITMASAPDRRTATTYMPGGEPRTVTNGVGHVTEFAYDALNREIRQRDTVTDADGNTSTLEIAAQYDANGNKTLERDRRGIEHAFEYDKLNRLTTARVGGHAVTTKTYDAVGNVLTETDLHGHQTRYEYDALYRRVRTTLPLAPYFTTVTYDLLGNVLRETDANGKVAQRAYDGVNRLTSTTDQVDVVKRFEYDSAGNRTLDENVTTGARVRTEFDGLNRPIVIRQEFTDPLTNEPVVYTTSIVHHDDDHTKVTTSPRGVVSRERFNGHDALIERTIDAGTEPTCAPVSGGPTCLTTTFRYDGNGNVTAEKDAVGGVIDREVVYDGLKRKITEITPLGGVERWYYDGNDNIVRTVDRRRIESRIEFDTLDREVRRTVVESISNNGVPLVVSEKTFDDAGNAVTLRDANRNATRQEFDALHRPTVKTDALGQTWTTAWDGIHQVAEVDNTRGIRIELLHDAVGRQTERRVITSSGPVANRISYLDAANRRVETDANGSTTIFQLDPLGRTRRVSQSDGRLAAFYGVAEFTLEEQAYDSHGNVTRIIDANGNVTMLEYDGGDRRVRMIQAANTPDQTIATYSYDRADNLLTIKDGRQHGRAFDVRYTYDARNRNVLAEDGVGNVATYQWDQNDKLALVIEPNGGAHRTAYSYDELGAVIAIDETRGGVGGVTRFLFDGNRNRIGQQDAVGNLTTYRYDALNRMTEMLQHSAAGALAAGRPRAAGTGGDAATARRWLYAYDSGSNQTRIVDAANQVVEKTYDERDRHVRRTYLNHQPDAAGNHVFPRPLAIEHRYDANGNLVRVDEVKEVSPGQSVTETSTYEYDPLNRTVAHTNPDGKTLRFEYDRFGNQRVLVDADGTRTSYAFDAKNRPISATEGGAATRFAYWPDDLTRTIVHPDGTTAETAYDAADRVIRIANANQQVTISEFTYAYDANGNRLTQTEQHARLAGGAAQLTTYQYDAANRLTGVDYPGTPKLTYTYSANGNRLFESGTAPNAATVARSYSYDRFNQLNAIADAIDPLASVAVRYDRNGNTVERRIGALDGEGGDVPAPTRVETFSWNIRDFLTRSTGSSGAITYDYDYAGRRRRMTTSSFDIRYLYDAGGVVQEYEAAALNTTLRYGRGPGGVFAMMAGASGAPRFSYLVDALGSTSELVDQSGAVRASYSYNPFGETLQHFDLTPNRRTFTGHYNDVESNLLYMGARYTATANGRFLSQDPYHGDPFVPASLNRYSYAHNNPTLFVDPDGRAINLAAAGIGFVAGGAIGCAAGWFGGSGCLKGAAVGAAAGGLAGLTFGASMAVTGGSFLVSSTVAGAAGGYAYGAGGVLAEGGSLQDAHEYGTVTAFLGAAGGATGGVFLEAGVGLTGAQMVITEFVAGFAESAGAQMAGMAIGAQDSFSFNEALVSGGLGGLSPAVGKKLDWVGRGTDRLGIAAQLMLRPRIDNKAPNGVLTFRGAYALAGSCLDAGCAHFGGLGGKSIGALAKNVVASFTSSTTSRAARPEWKVVDGKMKAVKHSNDLDWAVYGPGRDFAEDVTGGIRLNKQIGSKPIDTIHGLLGGYLETNRWIPKTIVDPDTGTIITGVREKVRAQYGDAIRAVDYWKKGIDIGGGRRFAPLIKGGAVKLRELEPHSFEILRGPAINPRFRLFWMQVPNQGEETRK